MGICVEPSGRIILYLNIDNVDSDGLHDLCNEAGFLEVLALRTLKV